MRSISLQNTMRGVVLKTYNRDEDVDKTKHTVY